jgi:drug/metabolite transporter (DMT)-like permease
VIWSFLALGSALLYGAADFLCGLAARRTNTIAVVLVSQLSGVVLLVLMLPFLPAAEPSTRDIVWGGAAGLAGGTGVALLYRALAIGTMAVVAPTTAVCAVAIPVMAALMFGERPAPLTLLGIGLAIVAIVLVSQERTRTVEIAHRSVSRFPKGLGLALLSGVAIGFFFLFLTRTAPSAGLWPLVAARSASVALFGLIAIGARRSLWMIPSVAAIVIGGGAIDMLANALYLVASRNGPLSVVVTLSSLYPASTVVLAGLVLGERLNAWQQAGIVCALVAVTLIVRAP